MVEVRTVSSNRNLRDGLVGGIAQIKMVEGVGFEPTYAKRPDLQSGGFNHSPTPPQERRGSLWKAIPAAGEQRRLPMRPFGNGVYSGARQRAQHVRG